MLNIETKAKVLSDGSYERYVAYRRASFFADKERLTLGEVSDTTQNTLDEKMVDCAEFTELELIECERLYTNNRNRAKRLRRRIEKWSKYGYVYFVTLTFKDAVFDDTSEIWRRKLVGYYLKGLGAMYCANIDYGGQFGREHYHAIICVEKALQGEYQEHKGNVLYNCVEFSEWNEKRGYTCIQGPILATNDDDNKNPLKIAKYTAKASNHALKETTRQHRLIYSRGSCPWRQPTTFTWDGWYTITERELADLPFDCTADE